MKFQNLFKDRDLSKRLFRKTRKLTENGGNCFIYLTQYPPLSTFVEQHFPYRAMHNGRLNHIDQRFSCPFFRKAIGLESISPKNFHREKVAFR